LPVKILYLASNSIEAPSLRLVQEINSLQRDTPGSSVGEPVQFVFLPDTRYDDIRNQITAHKPDIVHMSAHGDEYALEAINMRGETIAISPEDLRIFFDGGFSPKLLYLNSCDSARLAEQIIDVVPMSIGMTSSITNVAARNAAVTFYSRLLAGKTVGKAFDAGKHIVQRLDGNSAGAKLFARDGTYPYRTTLHTPCRIVAKFADDRYEARKNGYFDLRLGLLGCPPNTSQVVFMTDDESFLGKNSANLESDLCSVVRTYPVNGEIWLDHTWSMNGDVRIFAFANTNGGECVSLGSRICLALQEYYLAAHGLDVSAELPGYIQKAISALLSRNGAELSSIRHSVRQKTSSKGARKRANATR
jgi:hypothetical protein